MLLILVLDSLHEEVQDGVQEALRRIGSQAVHVLQAVLQCVHFLNKRLHRSGFLLADQT
jgi:hypothetical protein